MDSVCQTQAPGSIYQGYHCNRLFVEGRAEGGAGECHGRTCKGLFQWPRGCSCLAKAAGLARPGMKRYPRGALVRGWPTAARVPAVERSSYLVGYSGWCALAHFVELLNQM